MNDNLFDILLNALKKIEDETNLSQDDVTKGFKKLFPLIESIGNDEGDVLDSIIYEGFYFLLFRLFRKNSFEINKYERPIYD